MSDLQLALAVGRVADALNRIAIAIEMQQHTDPVDREALDRLVSLQTSDVERHLAAHAAEAVLAAEDQ